MLTGAMGVRSMATAGVGFIRSGLRRTPPVQSAEQLLCNSSRPVSALTASLENDLVMEAGEPVPRLVFGGVPSFEETEEATRQLKEVLDEMYLSSPKSFELETSLIPGGSQPLNTEMIVDDISGVIMENNASTNSGLKHVHQAFRFLYHNPEVQTVISSIARDQKVFEAVCNNHEVKKLFHSYQTGSDTLEDETNVTQDGESGAGVMEKLRNVKDFITKMVTDIPIHLPGLSGPDQKENPTMKDGKSGSSRFVEKLRNLKKSVVEMATNITKHLQNLYGSSAAESVSGSDDKGNTQSSPELSLGTRLTGLAIMVIMIVVFKRV